MARPLELAVVRSDAALAFCVIGIVAMLVVPLPTPLLDLLIACNIGLSVLVIAVSLYVRDAVRFATFPTLLLLTTLFRLGLNVSSTRLILLQADAGRIIEAFGRVLVRGDYVVGAVVFAILTVIQFVVIARGAERVAEVGARFSLDAMPGKQLAIDAELRAGSASHEAARAARRALERESKFYGALDGAMKFVKGDAIAGLIIIVVNLAGGVAIGTLERGLSLSDSLRTYGLLTIGDGLVSQIPALLCSTAAGIVVTRVAALEGDATLGEELARQLGGDRRALVIAALLLAFLALVPGLPAWPFIVVAAVLGFAAARTVDESTKLHASSERKPLTLDDVQARLNALEQRAPVLVRHVVPEPVSLAVLTDVLRSLDEEGVPTDALEPVLSAFTRVPKNTAAAELIARARVALRAEISRAHAHDGVVTALRLSPELEEAITDAITGEGDGAFLALPPDLSREIVAAVLRATERHPQAKALLVSARARPFAFRLLADAAPGLAVLCPDELDPRLQLRTAELITP